MTTKPKPRLGIAFALGLACTLGACDGSQSPATHAAGHAHAIAVDAVSPASAASPAIEYTRCEEIDDALSGGAVAHWSADLGRSMRWTRNNPSVLIEAGAEEGISLELVAEAFFGGGRFVLNEEAHRLNPGQSTTVSIDLSSMSDQDERQLDSETLVRVGIYELDASGVRNGRQAILKDLLLLGESGGRLGLRIHEDEDGDALEGEVAVLDAPEIRAMKDRVRAKRFERKPERTVPPRTRRR